MKIKTINTLEIFKKITIALVLLFLVGGKLIMTSVHAGPETPNGDEFRSNLPQGITNPILQPEVGAAQEEAKSGSLFFTMLGGTLRFMMVLALIWTLLQLVMGAITWISSGSDSGKLEQARNRLTHAIIGVIVLSATFAIWLFVQQFLGVEVTFTPLFADQKQVEEQSGAEGKATDNGKATKQNNNLNNLDLRLEPK